ncbi:alpha/beta fold hydrolase [Marinoscillum sp.]|uniref:alpha/beta fold hydrolase n=1 Tax=Marinoscillum sp. TaxID=2024838 RepID=UPI003BA89185
MKNTFTLALFLSLWNVCIAQDHHFFDSFDGTKIAYQDMGKGQPVILLHGFISNGTSWNGTALTKKLQDHGYRLIIPDLRGNGKSDRSHDPSKYAEDAEIKDMVALANHLNLSEYRAVGYSRGSIVLAKLLTQEDRITQAVIGGMGIDFSNPEWDRRIMFAEAFGGRAPLNEITEGAVSYAKSVGADLEILSLLQTYQPVTSKAELGQIDTSVLVIAGDQDTDNGDPAALHQALPNSQLVIVPGDHNTTYRTEPFAQEVLKYFNEN